MFQAVTSGYITEAFGAMEIKKVFLKHFAPELEKRMLPALLILALVIYYRKEIDPFPVVVLGVPFP